MSLRSRMAGWFGKSANYTGYQSWITDWLGGNVTSSGIAVGPDSAQASAAACACVQVRSQDIAKLPLVLYRRSGKTGSVRAREHALYNVVAYRPNRFQTSFVWREGMQAALDLTGNAYSRIVRDGRQNVTEVIPLNDSWVSPLRTSDGTPFYDVKMFGIGTTERLPASEILHLRDRTDDGFLGKSVIARARDVFGLDLAGARHASKLWANGARPGGILSHPGKLTKEGRALVKKSFVDEFGGVDQSNKVAVFAEDLKYTPLGMNSVDAQFLESRKMSAMEIAALFRVPPHMIGHLEDATFSNIEHQKLSFVQDCLMPIARRWEQELNVALLKQSEQDDYYFEFLFDGLLRGDFKSRMDGYAVGRQWGIFSLNDIMEYENRPPIDGPGGDERLAPMNMAPVGLPRASPGSTANGSPDATDDSPSDASADVPLKFIRPKIVAAE